MKPTLPATAVALALLLGSWGPPPRAAEEGPRIFRVEDRGEIPLGKMLEDLAGAKVVFVGEMHNNAAHHRAQLDVIRGLHERGLAVAVAVEMFPALAQAQLDLWSAGKMGEGSFYRLYIEHWGIDYWPLYRDIFIYARDEGLPVVGLNIPREVVRQVAQGGFESLSDEQREMIPGVSCNVDPEYRRLMSELLSTPSKAKGALDNFCEAQVVWDTAMALNIMKFREANPEHLVVVLAGTMHSWKYGIPAQLRRRSEAPFRVVLPSDDRSYLGYDIMLEKADYVWWHEAPPLPRFGGGESEGVH